jgi:tripartite-type tricarboxylate transporter receptor subunit TctC
LIPVKIGFAACAASRLISGLPSRQDADDNETQAAMIIPRRRFLQLIAGTLPFAAPAQTANAQDYPTRPITLIVPYGAGGPTDAIARIVAERMRVPLGQPVIIENVTGASAAIGVGKAARAMPDGYVICIGTWASHVLNGAVFPLSYNLQTGFEPIAQLASDPPLIVSKKSLPANDLGELIAWLKANPDKATQGTGGAGTVAHVLGVFFQNRTDTRFQFIPYRSGVGMAMQDVVAGQIDLLFSVAASAVPLLRAGTIKGYAVASPNRLGAAPEIPTVDEAGLPGFHASNWHGIWAPKGTPAAVVDRLNLAIVDTLADPAVRKRLVDLGQEIASRERQTPEGLAALQSAEIDKWWPIIKAAGIKAE